MRYTEKEVFQIVQATMAESLKVPAVEIAFDANLYHELDVTSLDYVDFTFRLEKRLGVILFTGSLMELLSSAFGAEMLVKQGQLTELGAEIIRRRHPEIEPNKIQAGMYPTAVSELQKTATWVRVVKELLAARPQSCPDCDSNELKLVRPSVLVCVECGSEVNCPTQEELLRNWAQETAAQLSSAV